MLKNGLGKLNAESWEGQTYHDNDVTNFQNRIPSTFFEIFGSVSISWILLHQIVFWINKFSISLDQFFYGQAIIGNTELPDQELLHTKNIFFAFALKDSSSCRVRDLHMFTSHGYVKFTPPPSHNQKKINIYRKIRNNLKVNAMYTITIKTYANE